MSGTHTDGTQAVFEDIVEPGVGPGRHIHHGQDETFFFLEGRFDVEVGGVVHHMEPGDVAFVPRGTVHAFKNVGDTRGRIRYIFAPALKMEEMFRTFYAAQERNALTAERMAAIALEHGQEFVGPPYRYPWASGAPRVGSNSVVNKKRAGLSPTMNVEQFDNGYWYATEVRSFAKAIGIPRVSALRKDELEDLIKHFLRTGRIKISSRRTQTPFGKADSDRPITRRRRVVHYKNDRATKEFLEDERARLAPGQRKKSGALYRLNRWREEQIAAGHPITYGNLAKKYVELSVHEGSFAQARSGRYINFLSDFLKNEKAATREDAIAAWHELKSLDTPKTYVDWKTHQPYLRIER